MLKLCVGCDGISDLESWIAESMSLRRRAGKPEEQIHTTRMMPKRIAEILDGGSLYWVIKGQIACRQKLLDLRSFTETPTGFRDARLVLEPVVTPVLPRPCRPFQGWRYLQHGSTPTDVAAGDGEIAAMPDEMWRELRTLGLL